MGYGRGLWDEPSAVDQDPGASIAAEPQAHYVDVRRGAGDWGSAEEGGRRVGWRQSVFERSNRTALAHGRSGRLSSR